MRNGQLFLLAVMALALTGCLGKRPPAPTRWSIDVSSVALTRQAPAVGRPAVRYTAGPVTVRSPFDGQKFAVLRADGSMAFDYYNVFAARPAALLRGAAADVLAAIAPENPGSTAVLPLTVTHLALDCRVPGRRQALVVLSARGKRIQASADAADGDYSRAFSEAFALALVQAVAEGG